MTLPHVLAKSVFSMIDPALHSGLIELSVRHAFTQGDHINERLSTNHLYILLTGEFELVHLETGLLHDSGIPGRSIELNTLILDQPKWEFDWIAKSDGELIGIPFQNLKAALEASDRYAYLERIVTQIELHKLKNDLRYLGLDQLESQKMITALKEQALSTPEDLLSLKPGSLVVVSEGSVSVKLAHGERTLEIKTFTISDYFIYLSDPNLHYAPSSDSKVWTLDPSLLPAEPGHVALLNVIEHKRFEVQTSVSKIDFDDSSGDEPESEEDDTLEVSDFLKEVPLPNKIKVGKPVHLMQFDEMDCGAACMAMISHYYQKKINISTWRSLIHVTREGASMLAVRNGAKHVGFDCIGMMAGANYLHRYRTPFIALMAYHYVVVYEVTDTSVTFADPGRGMMTLPLDEFAIDYSSNCLMIKPTDRLLAFAESVPSYHKYVFLFKDLAQDLAVISLFSVLLFALSLAPPLFMQFIFDQVLKTRDPALLNRVGLAIVGLTLFMAIAGFIRSLMLARMTNAMGVRLSTLFFRQTLRLPFNYFAVRNVGDITTRLQELQKIKGFLSRDLISIFIQIIALVLYSVVFYLYDPRFFFLALFFMVVLFTVSTPLFKAMVHIRQRFFYALGKNQSATFEQMRSLKTIQSMAASLQARWKWEETYDGVLNMRAQAFRYSLKLFTVNSVAHQVVSLSFLLLAVKLFMSGELTLGQVVAVNTLALSLLSPILGLVQVVEQATQIKVSFDKIDEIVTSPIESLVKTEVVTTGKGQIEFKNIWFQYGSDLSPWVLKNVDLTIKPGEKIAFVGQSGSGKSTLAYMVNRIYTATQGSVLLDGIPNHELPLAQLRTRVSTILQDPSVFSGTLIDNIAFGDELPVMDKVLAAAKIAEAHDFISQLPLGYSTVIGNGIKDLSGGQKQRIAIARAIYRSPEILILDEATSSLDSITEKRILNNLRQSLTTTTCLTIAHRLNTIIESDRIVVIGHGKVLEQGRHDELMRAQGAYYQMFRKQVG